MLPPLLAKVHLVFGSCQTLMATRNGGNRHRKVRWATLVAYITLALHHLGPQDDGKWVMSYTMMAACHLACNFRLALVIRTWNLAVASLFVLSVFFYWIFAALYCIFPPDFSGGMYYVNQQVFCVCTCPEFFLKKEVQQTKCAVSWVA